MFGALRPNSLVVVRRSAAPSRNPEALQRLVPSVLDFSSDLGDPMKTACFIFCVLCVSTALGQNVAGTNVLSAQPVPLAFSSRPEHASAKSLAQEESILGTFCNVSAHGERPLWEFASKTVEVPLGDVARKLRKEHTVAKKSNAVFENQ